MADLAGAVVGITSLGIQVCEHLIRYYTDFRSFDDDIDAVVKRIEDLKANLRVVELTIHGPTIPNNPNNVVLKQVQETSDACEQGLRKLEAMMKRCGRTQIPGNLQDKVKFVGKKLFWPLKKDTLMELQDTVDRLQANLHLAIQMLGIDVERRHFEIIASTTNSLVARSDNIEQHLGNQDIALHGVQGSVDALYTLQQQHANSIDLHTAIQNGQLHTQMQSLQGIEGEISTLLTHQKNMASTIDSRIANEAAQLGFQVESVAQQLAFLSSQMTQVHGLLQMPTGLLQSTQAAYRNIEPLFERNLRKYKGSIQNFPQPIAMNCDCHAFSRPQQSCSRGWLSYTISRYQSEHLPTCPRFPHADFSHVVEKQFTYCTRILRRCFKVGFLHARVAGWISLYPTLSFRAVVPDDSPVFRYFKDARNLILDVGENKTPPTNAMLQSILARTSESIIQNFREGRATPTDMTPSGKTIMHGACLLIAEVMVHQQKYEPAHCRDYDVEILCTFLDSFVKEGVPCNETDLIMVTPLQWLLLCRGPSALRKPVCQFFIQRLHSSDTWNYSNKRSDKYSLDDLADLLALESISESYEAPSAFEEAIHQRSISKMKYLLQTSNTTWDSSSPASGNYTLEGLLTPSISWPEGIRLILDWARSQTTSTLQWTDSPVWEAVFTNCPNSMHVLLQEECPMDATVWTMACSPKLNIYHERYNKFRNGHECREYFAAMAKAMIKRRQLGEYNKLLYHADGLSLYAATSLWNAGFHEIDCIGRQRLETEQGTYHDLKGTPLWLHSLSYPTRDNIALLEWFVTKGARLDLHHPQYSTTPRNYLSAGIAEYLNKDPAPSVPLRFIRHIVWSTLRDKCTCLCSESGCLPITKMFAQGFAVETDNICTDNPELQLMIRGMLRYVTFNLLGLTHTCCTRDVHMQEVLYGHPPITKEEIRDTHYVETKDIELFRVLIAELEEQAQRYAGTFSSFLNDVLLPLVRTARDQVPTMDHEHLKELLVELTCTLEPKENTSARPEVKWEVVLSEHGAEHLNLRRTHNHRDYNVHSSLFEYDRPLFELVLEDESHSF